MVEEVCITVPKEACHKVAYFFIGHVLNVQSFQGTQEVCTIEKVAKEVIGGSKYLFVENAVARFVQEAGLISFWGR